MNLLRILAVAVSAATFSKPDRCEPTQLRQSLESAGFKVANVEWAPGLGCRVQLDSAERKDPTAIIAADVYIDPVTAAANAAAARKARVAYLLQGMVSGTLTAAEKDELASLLTAAH